MNDPLTLMTDFTRWLVETAAETRDMRAGELHRLLCDKLVALGIPLWRSSLGLELLNPEFEGVQLRWVAHEASIDTLPRGGDWSDYENSPAQIVDNTGKPYRRKLDAPVTDLALLEDLRRDGATDYLIVPLPFLDQQRTAHISFASQKPGGFSDREIAALSDAALLLTPYAERFMWRRSSDTLLTTYVGRRSAAKVFGGALDRGKAEIITATILIADMRGFTQYSDTRPIGNVLSTLNDFFDALVAAIEAQGGEVLKFIGDALLAIFPANDGQPVPTAPAIAAALDIRHRIAALNVERTTASRTQIRFGLALDAGEIAYGNIGSRTRLDFTAIGPAINRASRLIELAKRLDRDIVVSESFAGAAQGFDFQNLGHHRVRDIAETQPVFAIA
ncbi:adenylate/guanylate cyclase domain-containing protein [Nordella sp. HKS 07]|uniref:adenylate/guanylate cyclase domain-containing protein n=1 Tax=Nordella sp. HKS 07 TaxID=2712222 RepID=UPI0013E1236C|nr:adenylate/guanylate cyclase domain-containing protein [Nordella sp. HKS 07]QIG50131.1 adenylate/guanylate cyclase domain-containing protein [Nordella sp. HKS 07]